MQDVVLFEELSAGDKVIGVATLNSEKSLNALSLAMAEKLLPQLKKWADDDKVACVWLQGSGEKAFCAGGDIVAAPCRNTGEAFIMTQIEIGLSTVLGDVDLAVLKRAHGTGIHIDVGIQF